MIYFVTHCNKEELLQLIKLSKDNGTSTILFADKDSAQRFLSEVSRTRHCRGLRIVELSITDISGTLEDDYDEIIKPKIVEDGK